jgi:4-amino-4-deoxy-L-arabinose transferase-like glycosyltransferase
MEYPANTQSRRHNGMTRHGARGFLMRVAGLGGNKDFGIIVVLLTLTAVVRLWTVMMIHTGVDERDYWYSAKALTQSGVNYIHVNHRTVRWGVIIPVAFGQLFSGTHPNAYYVMPILNAMIQTVLIFFLGKKIKNRKTGFIAALFLILFPYQIRAASQVRPEIFSITYIMAAFYFFTAYSGCADRRKKLLFLAASSIFLYIAYLAKITNLFFLPGFFTLLFLYSPRTWKRDSLILGGIPFLLYIVETILYAWLTGYRFGHLSIIFENHFTGMETLNSFWEIFDRYSFSNLQPYWQIPFIIFLALAVYTLWKNRRRELRMLIIPAFSFFFFITFTVSSIHPLKMAEPFTNRYFCAVLPPVFLVIAWYTDMVCAKYAIYRRFSKKAVPVCFLGILLFVVVFSQRFVPGKIRQYIHAPFDKTAHPFYVNDQYFHEINSLWADGIPIVAVNETGGKNALYTASWYYLLPRAYVNGRPPNPERLESAGESPGLVSLGGRPVEGQTEVLAAIRTPFRIRLLAKEKLPALRSESFQE